MDAVFKGYGQNFDTVKWDTPDYDKLMHLERNVYQFSTAKNWQMMKELTLATKDGDRIVPFREFRGKALNIVDEYDAKWLKTEYNAAIASSQMASKWVGYEKAAALHTDNNLPEPLLQYRTQGDGRVREDHKVLDRITRPMSDNFWKTYYPPNGWNCRCTTVRLTTGTSSTDEVTNRAMADVAPQKGFNVNLAQEGFVFSPKSAYYVGLPEDVYHAHISIQRNEVKQWAKENLKGKNVPSPIGDIYLSGKNLNAAIGKKHPEEFFKNHAIYHLPELIKNGVPISKAGVVDEKERNQSWFYLKTEFAGKNMYLNIKKDTQTGVMAFYNITPKLK